MQVRGCARWSGRVADGADAMHIALNLKRVRLERRERDGLMRVCL